MMAIVVNGDACKPEDVEKAFAAIDGVDAVISTIGGTTADPTADSQARHACSRTLALLPSRAGQLSCCCCAGQHQPGRRSSSPWRQEVCARHEHWHGWAQRSVGQETTWQLCAWGLPPLACMHACMHGGAAASAPAPCVPAGDSKGAPPPHVYDVLKPVLLEKEKAEARLKVQPFTSALLQLATLPCRFVVLADSAQSTGSAC